MHESLRRRLDAAATTTPRHPLKQAATTLCLLLATFPAAARGDDGQSLTLREALDRSLSAHPGLAVARAGVEVAAAQVREAQLGPAFEAGLELENFAGSGETSGTDALETTLQLSRALEPGGKRAAAVAAARAGEASALASLEVSAVELAGDTARRFVTVLGAQEQLQAASRFLELARAIQVQAERRVDAGLGLSAELHRARAEVGRQQLFVARSRAELDLARRALAASWGEPGSPVPAVAGDLFGIPPLEPIDEFLRRVEQSPRLASLATVERLRIAEVRLAETESKPDLTFSFGVRHLAEPGDTALVAGVAVPLGTRARGRARAQAAEAALQLSQHQTAADRLAITSLVMSLHRQIELRREALQVLETQILPATAAALEQIDRGYRLGRLGYSEYAQAARESLDAQLERLELAAEFHQLLTELEALTGTGVFGPGRS